MATKLTAARQLILFAAEKYDAGERCDMEAGMAKLFASEIAMEIALERPADPRRLRLLHRVRRGALLPRRPADDRRRGHQRDPAQRHRRQLVNGAGSTEPAGCRRRMRIGAGVRACPDHVVDGVARLLPTSR
jgi:hypothetical protein